MMIRTSKGLGLVPDTQIPPLFPALHPLDPLDPSLEVVWVVRKETFTSMRKYCESRFWA